MNKLYLILWTAKYEPEWHCHAVHSDKKLMELKLEVAKLENPDLIHIMAEIDNPVPDETFTHRVRKQKEPTLMERVDTVLTKLDEREKKTHTN